MVSYEADFEEDTIYSFGGIFITCFRLCCIAWCALCQRTVSCHFAANANSQDTFLGLFKTLTYIATQEVTSYAYFICEARVVTIPQSTQ